ncbi:MAG: nuclear transport factor 2 family protein [Polyangiaceae bacterium]|nr:nuclear transport factor 2 family protein [Polyangiaceae bacterium]
MRPRSLRSAFALLVRALLVAGVAGVACAPGAGALEPELARDERAARARSAHALLDAWHEAAARGDEASYFGAFAPEGVFLGTDAGERWDVAAFRAYAHPHFARGKAWAFRAERRTVTLGDGARVAWFDERLATEKLGPARGSGVLLWRDGGWCIAQYNLGLTIPNERFEAVRDLLAAPP